MDFIDQLRQFSSRVVQLKDQITTEEATKTSIIMPFFQMLGYDIFNPLEFAPEYVADVGIKKGEKVDYAILKDGKPVILIEAKWCGESLEKHDGQLLRYFHTSPAKFGILTNGIVFRFYTDLDNPNKMDETPFFEFNLLDIRESSALQLKNFHKQVFDVDNVFSKASELKYVGLIKQYVAQQVTIPSDEFVTFIVGQVYKGRKTQPVIEKFRDLIKTSFNHYLSELLNDRLLAALDHNKAEDRKVDTKEVALSEEIVERKVVTTMEELEAFYAVKAIVREVIPPERIVHRDTGSYFGILVDDNKLKWLCRLQLEGAKKNILIPDADKKPAKFPLNCIDDIYALQSRLIEVAKRYN